MRLKLPFGIDLEFRRETTAERLERVVRERRGKEWNDFVEALRKQPLTLEKEAKR